MLGTGNLLYPFYIHYFKKEMLQQMEAQLDYLQAQKGACTLYAIDNYTDDIALPLYLIESGFKANNITRDMNMHFGSRDYNLTKGDRRVHVVLISDSQRLMFIKNYKQSRMPAYITAGAYEYATLYENMAKTNPKLKKVATGLYQLVLDER